MQNKTVKVRIAELIQRVKKKKPPPVFSRKRKEIYIFPCGSLRHLSAESCNTKFLLIFTDIVIFICQV